MTQFPQRKWAFGLDSLQRSERMALATVSKDVEPTGQLEPKDEGPKVAREKKKEHLEANAWAVATAPGKQFMMTAFMLWMMGSGVHIMNIIFTVYQLIGPIKGMFQVGAVFKPFAEAAKEHGVDLTLQKLVYIACQLGVLLFITHRFGSMGLLPTSASDWMGMVPVKVPQEYASGGFAL